MVDIAFRDSTEGAGGSKEVVWLLNGMTITLTKTDQADELNFQQTRAQLSALYGDPNG